MHTNARQSAAINPQGNNEGGHAMGTCECEWTCRPHYEVPHISYTPTVTVPSHHPPTHTHTQTDTELKLYAYSYSSVFLSVCLSVCLSHGHYVLWCWIWCDNVLIGGCCAGQQVPWWSQWSIHRLDQESQWSDSSFISAFHPCSHLKVDKGTFFSLAHFSIFVFFLYSSPFHKFPPSRCHRFVWLFISPFLYLLLLHSFFASLVSLFLISFLDPSLIPFPPCARDWVFVPSLLPSFLAFFFIHFLPYASSFLSTFDSSTFSPFHHAPGVTFCLFIYSFFHLFLLRVQSIILSFLRHTFLSLLLCLPPVVPSFLFYWDVIVTHRVWPDDKMLDGYQKDEI